MATSDIDELLHDLRKREQLLRKAANDTPPMFSLDKGMMTNDADQCARWIAAVKELRDELENMEHQHGYREYWNGDPPKS